MQREMLDFNYVNHVPDGAVFTLEMTSERMKDAPEVQQNNAEKIVSRRRTQTFWDEISLSRQLASELEADMQLVNDKMSSFGDSTKDLRPIKPYPNLSPKVISTDSRASKKVTFALVPAERRGKKKAEVNP